MEQPLVSVSVITYNSSKTVLETLESIKAQTYQNIELIVSDDCSTDNTVELCRNWIEQNKSRFVRTELLTVEKNTGISGNFNRAETECAGEWAKGVAGDDLLMPNCIEDCISYVLKNNIKCLFGNMVAFDGEKGYCEWLTKTHRKRNIQMAKLSTKELYKMIFEGDTPPAPAFFYNISEFRKHGIKNDERIPFMEDWPKWLNILKKGIDMHFMNKDIVKYRVGGISTTNEWWSLKTYRSKRLFFYFYQFQELYDANQEKTVFQVVSDECSIYQQYIETQEKLESLKKSKSYMIGKFIMYPFSKIRRLCHRIIR